MFLHLIFAMSKVLLILQPFIRSLVQAMSQSSLLTSLSVTVVKLQSQSLMKLKLDFRIQFMAVCPIFFHSNNRFISLYISHNLHIIESPNQLIYVLNLYYKLINTQLHVHFFLIIDIFCVYIGG